MSAALTTDCQKNQFYMERKEETRIEENNEKKNKGEEKSLLVVFSEYV